ncbi:MAG: hypothetical protein FWD42_01395 [Solirubrobacterales bacterium]|nr:hypothetical protein [Solirubrobacterales bacterium]
MRGLARSIGATVAIALLLAAVAGGAGEIVLGARQFAGRFGEGWGTARPTRIFNGGDPSGLVTHIHWISWGGAAATGYGLTSLFRPHGGYYRRPARIELRAHALGACTPHGPHAYTRLSFRVPTRPGGPLGRRWIPWASAGGSICR